MQPLTIIYFLESGQIIPFLKIENDSNKEFYDIRKIMNNNNLNDEIKKYLILSIKKQKYIKLLKKGYTYQEIENTIAKGMEKILERDTYSGINELNEEKDALNLAILQYQNNNNKSLIKRPKL